MSKAAMGDILQDNESAILSEWVKQQVAGSSRRDVSEAELREQSRGFLASFAAASRKSFDEKLDGPLWDEVRTTLSNLSRSRAQLGYSPAETATFVFSLKKPLFSALRKALASDAQTLNEQTWLTSSVLDILGLVTVEAHQKGREQIIIRQQQELLDLSTPVIKMWDGIVAVPLIGTLDSERTQVVMESLLDAIVEHEATVAIIDITGVPTVDTLVAQHLLKAVAAARLMGADCIISGIRPQIAQTIVHLGVDLGDVVTKATLADALKLALARRELRVTSVRRRDASEAA